MGQKYHSNSSQGFIEGPKYVRLWPKTLAAEDNVRRLGHMTLSRSGKKEIFMEVHILLRLDRSLLLRRQTSIWRIWSSMKKALPSLNKTLERSPSKSFNRIFIEWFLHMLGYPKHLIVTCFVRALEKVYDNEMFHLTKRYEELSIQVQQQMINHRSLIEILLIFIVLGWFVSTSASSLLVFSWCSWQNFIFSLIFDQNINKIRDLFKVKLYTIRS